MTLRRKRTSSSRSIRSSTRKKSSLRVSRNTRQYRGIPLAVNVTIGNIGNSTVSPCPRLAELPQHDIIPYVAGRLKDMELELQGIYEGLDKGNIKLEHGISGLVGLREKMSEASTEITGMAALRQRALKHTKEAPVPTNAGPNGEPLY